MRKITLLLLSFFYISCSNLIHSIHNEIDKEEGFKGQARPTREQMYRDSINPFNRKKNDKRPIENPVTLNGPSTASVRNLPPSVPRNYANEGTRRAQSSDFLDNDSDGSLWTGQTPDSFLFVTNNIKREGDIVIVDVMGNLKKSISDELKRAFPAPPTAAANSKDDSKGEKSSDTNEEDDEAKDIDSNKVYDKISTSVVEQINADYLLLRGRKEVIYKKLKRYIEVQGIVAKKDIQNDDTVTSIKLLEPKVNVLRY